MKILIKETILKFMENNSTVSFVELERELAMKDIPHKGEYAWCLPDNENIIFWTGITQDFGEAMSDLVYKDKKIKPVESTPFVYFIDGKALNLPVAKDLKRKYKSPRWVPVVFNNGSLWEEVE